MRNFLLTSAAVAALLGGMAAADAQQAPGMRGPAAEAAQNEPGAVKANREREPRAQRDERRAPAASPATRDRQSSTPSPRSTTTGQGSDREFDRPRSERQRGEANEPRRGQAGEQRDRDRNRSARDRDGDRNRNAAERSSPRERSTTGQSGDGRSADAPRRGDSRRDASRDRDRSERQDDRADRRESRDSRFRMTSEQRTRVSTRFSDRIDRMNVRPLSRSGISVSIGAVVPRSVHLHVVPQDIVAIYPRFRGHRFVVVEEEIVIVEPRGQRIVAVLPMSDGRQARAQVRETTGSAPARARLQLSPQERETIRTVVMREPACRLEQRVDFFLFVPIPRTVEICDLPREVVSTVPAVGAYRYAVRGDDIVLVDPEDHRVVEIID